MRNHLAAISATTGNATAWNPNANNTVLTIVVSGNTIYAGGDFTNIGGQVRGRIASFDAITGNLSTWNPIATSVVRTLALSGSTIYAGGDFTTIGGQPRNRIAALDITTGNVTDWNPNASGAIYTIAVADNILYAGGGFTGIGGQPRNRLAALEPAVNTNNATAWDPSSNNPIYTLSISSNYIFAGGSLTRIGDKYNNYLVGLEMSPALLCPSSNVVYVDSAATGANNGTNWENAFTSLSAAITLVHNCNIVDSILVAKGTYYPESITPTYSTTTARDKSFYFLRNNLALVGGYPTGGGVRNQETNATVLSGDIGVLNDSTDNAHHVIVVIGASSYSLNKIQIDGISVIRGNADLNATNISIKGHIINRGSGGAMYNVSANPHITNCNFFGNNATSGGAINNITASYNITNSTFYGNNATTKGGVINNNSSSTNIRNCSFSGNVAGLYGGVLYNEMSSSHVITNSTFSGNKAGDYGGVMYNQTSSSPIIINSILSGNNAVVGSAIYNSNSTPKISNTIIYGNSNGVGIFNSSSTPVITYSLIQGLSNTNNGNIDGATNPLFINAPSHTTAPFLGGDYRLAFCSPALGAGHNDSIPTGVTTDLAGNPRIIGTTVDMGAYEKQSNASNLGSNAALSTSSSNTLNFMATCEEAGWTWYAMPNNPDSLSFAIQWGNNNNAAKAAAKIQLIVDGNHHISSNNSDSAIITMNRYWNVDLDATTLVDPVSVRFFFDAADTIAMRSALNAQNIGIADKLAWFKTNGVPYNNSLVAYSNINGGNFTRLTPTYGNLNGVPYVEFNAITSFSGGTAGIGIKSSSPLPLTLLNFKALATDNQTTQLLWETAQEHNVATIEIERSNDGKTWRLIGAQKAKGANQNSYSAVDENPMKGDNFYRLKMIDNDASFSLSEVQKVHFKHINAANVMVYPNPTSGNFTIAVNGIEDQTGVLTIYDVLGRVAYTTNIKNERTTIANSQLTSGIYKIHVQFGNRTFVQKLVVE